MIRMNGVDVSRDVAVRILFTDPRISILPTLYIVNAFVFIISLPLQVFIKSFKLLLNQLFWTLSFDR